jgi:RNA-splicing ligase RtcB
MKLSRLARPGQPRDLPAQSLVRGLAEEAPGAHKDISAVVDAAEAAQLARKVAKLVPVACVKG